MPVYRYTCTSGDGRDGFSLPNSRIFEKRNDARAIAMILRERKLFLSLGGFTSNEKLERGTLKRVGIKLVFTPTNKISVPKIKPN